MAGYIGSKAVSLSTTGADIAGDADVSGALDVGGAFTSQGIDDNATSTAMTLDASGNVGIGVVPDNANLPTVISEYGIYSGNSQANITANTYYNSGWKYEDTNTATRYNQTNGVHYWYTAASGTADTAISWSEAMRISGGNLLVGTTSNASAGDVNSFSGEQLRCKTAIMTVVSGAGASGAFFGHATSSGGGVRGLIFSNNGATIAPSSNGGISLGSSSLRWNDVYATNGTIQTSDRNEKQDIAELSDAEQRVAVAAKGLMRKFRWRDAVEAKGDDARTHFGIIAQDLQAAFAAEGLDAGDYAMFISTTWWEHDVEVPAVEAVAEVTETTTDEDGNEVVTVVTEAVEAVDAYTRTDTYDTQEEAPEGATERTRLGVRYSELLAFIIGAL
jgi:hypothetical protein